jgi:PAS domain S-box-containing protein
MEERRESERRLRASEQLFATAFRQGPDAIALSRQSDGTVVEANDRWLELLGYAPGTAPSSVTPLHEHLDESNRRRLLALAGARADGQDMEIVVTDRHGIAHATLAAVSPVEVAGETCHITILRDITPQRLAESDAREQRRQLTHLTRVASLSDFSSTIAHELNQPLTAILANAQAALRFLQRDPPNVGEIRTILGEIAEADKRAGLLIHHLRLLMKKGEEEYVQLDINHVVTDVLEFIRGEFLLRGVEVKTTMGRDLPQVQGDRVQLQQLVLNLVCNACDAMQGQPERRLLSISTAQTADGSVQVAVSDTGPGIAPERLDRVFEPFYTTKQSGLGMGLAICRRIAGSHGGTLMATSRSGEGATFRLTLPAVESVARPVAALVR